MAPPSFASTSIVLLVASVLLLVLPRSAHAAANFGGLAFYNDSACTVPYNPATLPGINATYTAWSSLPASAVTTAVQLYNASFTVPCVARPLPSFPLVASGEYACWNTDANHTRGFVAAEWIAAGCNDAAGAITFPFQAFSFAGPGTATCVPGTVAAFITDAQGNITGSSSNDAVWATFTCSGASLLPSSSSSTGSASNGSHNGSGAVRLRVSAALGLLGALAVVLLASMW